MKCSDHFAPISIRSGGGESNYGANKARIAVSGRSDPQVHLRGESPTTVAVSHRSMSCGKKASETFKRRLIRLLNPQQAAN